jgi:hypothetical protein
MPRSSLLLALIGLAALLLEDSAALAQRPGRAPEFAVGEAVQFRDIFRELHRGVVREHSEHFGYRVAYQDRSGWSQEEWVGEEKLGRAPPPGSPGLSVGQQIEFRDSSGEIEQGTVRGHHAVWGYRVAFKDHTGWARETWIGEEQIVNYSVTRKKQREFDLTPLYRAVGAAMCPLSAVVIVIVLLVRRWTRSPALQPSGYPFAGAALPPPPGSPFATPTTSNPFARPPAGGNSSAPPQPGNPFQH